MVYEWSLRPYIFLFSFIMIFIMWNLVRFTGQITDKPIEFDYIA